MVGVSHPHLCCGVREHGGAFTALGIGLDDLQEKLMEGLLVPVQLALPPCGPVSAPGSSLTKSEDHMEQMRTLPTGFILAKVRQTPGKLQMC